MTAEQLIAALEELTARMREAAEGQDFDRLTELSDQYVPLAEQLSAVPSALTESQRPAIENILLNQAAIAARTTPWLDSVRKLLRDNRQEQAIVAAYRSEP